MSNRLVSIIIPVYNAEKYLAACIDSVAAQLYENWELILVDDGSKDNSLAICQEYASQDSRIKAFTQVNSGPSAARNKGISKSIGEYVCFIDSDDTVTPTYVSDLICRDADLIVSGIIHIGISNEETYRTVKCEDSNLEELISYLDGNYKVHGPVAKLYRADIIKDNNIIFPLDLDYGEDLIFNLVYLNFVNTIAVTEACNYRYFHRETASLTNRTKPCHTMQRYVLQSLVCRKQLMAVHTFTNQLYYKVICQETAYYFWQTIHAALQQLEGIQRRIFISKFLSQVEDEYKYTELVQLPPRYKIMRRLFKYLPISLAIYISSKL